MRYACRKPIHPVFLLTAGYTLPMGVSVYVFAYCLHLDPNIYPDPHKFDPTRFTPENCQSRHPYAYVPFSAGPRNCVG